MSVRTIDLYTKMYIKLTDQLQADVVGREQVLQGISDQWLQHNANFLVHKRRDQFVHLPRECPPKIGEVDPVGELGSGQSH